MVPLTFADHQFDYVPPSIESSNGLTSNPNAIHEQQPAGGAVRAPTASIPRSTTQNIEDMVDDLVGAEAAMRNRSPSRLEQQNPGEESSRPASGTFNASDLVRQIAQGSPGTALNTPFQQRNHPTSFGFTHEAFAPAQSEFGGYLTGSRPGTAHQPLSPRLGQHRSSGFFNDELSKRQREIESRTSPLISMDPSSISNSPIYNYAQNRSRPSLQQDSWQSPFTSPPKQAHFGRQAPSPSRFGAIGDTRRAAAQSPTSGQPG
jgi:hypothetical protein